MGKGKSRNMNWAGIDMRPMAQHEELTDRKDCFFFLLEQHRAFENLPLAYERSCQSFRQEYIVWQ
jgi:hypothetical protein